MFILLYHILHIYVYFFSIAPRYDGTWQSLKDKSGQPHSHPKQHTLYEESLILEVWNEHGRKGIDYVYCVLIQEKGYTRSQGGLFHALRRLGLIEKPKKKGRKNYRQCTPCEIPGEKVQIDVKVVPMDSNRRMYPNKIFVYIRGTHT